jgi:serine/threonine protein kinase
MLVDAAFRVKIADLGLAKITSTSSLDEDNTKTFCGTLPWTAPEVFSNSGYSTKADVYSYAIVLWVCGN